MLAMIGIFDCTFHRISLRPSHVHYCVWGTAVLLPSQRGGRERKCHLFFFTPTVVILLWWVDGSDSTESPPVP